MLNRSASLGISTSVFKALPRKLDIKRHSPSRLVFSISGQASQCQQAFSKPCLVNLISKDTHLVFSITQQASQCQQAFLKPCLVNLISKDTHLVFSISRQASGCQQAFSKPCLENLISKDTHLVFSMYMYLKGDIWSCYEGLVIVPCYVMFDWSMISQNIEITR